MKFSVLMSVYYKEKPEYLQRSLESIWVDQTLKPTEIILVKDGPLTPELDMIINNWVNLLDSKLNIIALEQNGGLANALNMGLRHCNSEYIARMDTDDICTPLRFKTQIDFLEKNTLVDVVGTYISEIDEDGSLVKDVVKFPLEHKELFNLFKKRVPMVHPTTMFRKSFFEKAGTYSLELVLAEDYHLWYKGFLNGCVFANIPIIGLYFRRANDFYERRSGVKKLIGLLKFRLTKCNRELNYGIISDIYAILYFLIQISPKFVRKLSYKYLR